MRSTDSGDQDFFGLESAVGRIDARRDPVPLGVGDVARGRGDHLQIGESGKRGLSGLAPPLLAPAIELASEQ